MELGDVIRTTATTRYYTDEPVSDEVLYRVLELARFAPSGGNRQGWKVVVVRDAQLRRAVRDLYIGPWNAYAGRARSGQLAPKSTRVLSAAEEFAQQLHEVPVHLVVCAQLAALAITDADLERPSIVGGASIYPFVQNLLLACREQGLGAALTTLLCVEEPKAKELLGIPDSYGIATLIAVGHPDPRRPRQLTRQPVESFAFCERFDGPPLGVSSSQREG
ncbi:MAG: nitroreductase family protein [Egibacteraceae bacterium]